MYNQFYGFKEKPFNQTPDPSFFFASEHHQTALNALLYAIGERKGFIVLTGEVGCGKTTVARRLLRSVDRNVQTVSIFNTYLSPKGVITMILDDLGVQYTNGSKEKLLIQLNTYLIQQLQKNQNDVLIIDEAQNLSAACLEEVRMLSNLETEKEKLLQIILIGQPELRKKLEMPSLRQLRQRVSVQYHLKPLSEEDTQKYVLHRLDAAKANGRSYQDLFTPEAMQAIYKLSGGIPRVINHVCDGALLAGYVAESKQIGPDMIKEIGDELLYAHRA
jgi:putative secretion ATPase (PEP-CTERM system associated)